MWRSLLLSWLLATVGVSSGGIVTAWGGAWLLPQGDGQAIVYQPNVNDPIDLQTAETILLSRNNGEVVVI